MLAIAAALSVAMGPTTAAKPPERVVAIVTTQPHPDLSRPIADELAAAGYAVRVRNDATSMASGDLLASEPCASAWACVAVLVHGTGWAARILTDEPGGVHRRERMVLADGTGATGQTLGLRIAEALHAAENTPPPKPDVQPEPPPAPPPPPFARLLVGASLLVAGSPGNRRPTLGPSAGVSYFPRGVLGVDVSVHATALELTREEPEGVARLGMGWGWVGMAFRKTWPNLAAGVRAGGGPLLAWARGRATSEFSDRTRYSAGGILGASPFVDVRLGRSVFLRTSAWLLFTVPRLKLAVAGRQVASVGLPLLGGSVGLAWGRP